MKRKRFSVEQIVAVLKQADLGLPVADLIRQVGISKQTFYRWKKQYAGLESDQVRELKQVVDENARLKRLVAELSLDKAVLQDVLSKSSPASAHEGRCGLCGGIPRLQRAAGLFVDAPTPLHPAQAEQAGPTPGDPEAHARDRGDADPLWLPTRAHHAQARRLGDRQEPGLAALR